MFPLILVILKILYSRMRMLEGLPPVSDFCWTSGGRTGTPMKVLVGKTFHFVDHIWMAYVRSLRQHTGQSLGLIL